ncbi:MAG: SH3 domain-containing protein [Desulfobulbus sp.]
MIGRWLSKVLVKGVVMAVVGMQSLAVAAEYVSVSKDGVNLRSGPGTDTAILFELPIHYPLQVLGREGQWLRVTDFEGDKGYIVSSLVSNTPYVIVKVNECRIRKGPSTNDPVIGTGAREVIFAKGTQQGDWIKVTHPDVTGWLHKDLVWP